MEKPARPDHGASSRDPAARGGARGATRMPPPVASGASGASGAIDDDERARRLSSGPPVSIQLDAELSDAFELMQDNDIRHLPVLDGERLVGVVSERDLTVIESLMPGEWESIVVAEAMTPSPYAVPEQTPLREVVATMADRKYGCVVITGEGGELTGIFTTSDALRILAGSTTSRTIGQVLADKARHAAQVSGHAQGQGHGR
jgi:acetoin utilization protein AcuB